MQEANDGDQIKSDNAGPDDVETPEEKWQVSTYGTTLYNIPRVCPFCTYSNVYCNLASQRVHLHLAHIELASGGE
jgi:hypothetical protein